MALGQEQQPVGISDFIYRPGFSFRNPGAIVPATRAKQDPWVTMTWGPGPRTQWAKQQRWDSHMLPRYRAYFRRSAKQRTYLEGDFRELPGEHELGLGQAPGPTDKETSVVREGFMGKLGTVLTDVGDIFVARAEKEAEQARARADTLRDVLMQQAQQTFQQAQNYAPYLLIGGVAILGLVMMQRRRGRR